MIVLDHSMLAGKTVLLTGAGGGIGAETAKAFAQMGAKVLLADVDQEKGNKVTEEINRQYDHVADFYPVNLANEIDTKKACEDIFSKYGCPDILFNNAALVITGEIGEVPVEEWDRSYLVNLRAPILLTTLFLKKMKERNSGCVVFVSSSGAAPYLGAYEIYKTAQVEFCNALSMELEGTHVYTYTIAPGLVKTETAASSIETVAKAMGLTTEEFYRQNEEHILKAHDAGVGFAISVLKASEYHGQEISSIQAVNEFQSSPTLPSSTCVEEDREVSSAELFKKIKNTFDTQYNGWKERNIFERQWVLRDFKKHVGVPAETVKNEFDRIQKDLETGEGFQNISPQRLEKLLAYWQHQLQLLRGFEKDEQKFFAYSQEIKEWISDIQMLLNQIEH
ncbi:SDR family oxidoreductase [uncultured Levyella sp.]|uniref:SDR family NAD(P)-dependent oxidoreductase n=1 Tax=uncultured Levyella sp. TaxID=1715800 RepID=UPI002587F2B1|nr:SDR family oxidoreductase [uncultured Levyella sp.]